MGHAEHNSATASQSVDDKRASIAALGRAPRFASNRSVSLDAADRDSPDRPLAHQIFDFTWPLDFTSTSTIARS